jgi:hypothetical protein
MITKKVNVNSDLLIGGSDKEYWIRLPKSGFMFLHPKELITFGGKGKYLMTIQYSSDTDFNIFRFSNDRHNSIQTIDEKCLTAREWEAYFYKYKIEIYDTLGHKIVVPDAGEKIMNDKAEKPEDVILLHANKHSGDIQKDKKFDCEDNCPYCNDDVILIKPQYLLPVYDDIQWAKIYKNFKCLICGSEFWEVWTAYEDGYHFPDVDEDYFDEIGDYTDSYYDDRHDAYSADFDKAMKTGDLCLVDASYEHTIIELPLEVKVHILDLPYKYQYPIYRRSNNS